MDLRIKLLFGHLFHIPLQKNPWEFSKIGSNHSCSIGVSFSTSIVNIFCISNLFEEQENERKKVRNEQRNKERNKKCMKPRTEYLEDTWEKKSD